MSIAIKKYSHLAQYFWLALVIIAGIVTIGWLQAPQLESITQQSTNKSVEDFQKESQLEQVRLNLLKKAPTFGFDNLFADWVFLQFLQYFGDEEARNAIGYGLSLDYFDIIIDRDPLFRFAYYYASVSGAIYTAQPERSIAIMEKGLKSMTPEVPSGSYFLWRIKGTDELLFLGDSKAAIKSYETAAEWANISSEENSDYVAELSRQIADSLAKNPDSKSAQIYGWTTVFQNAVDDRTRETAIRRIQQLGGKIVVTPEGNLQVIPPEED
ncbi:MAG: hypothetical protein SAJ37_12665 [Oscillatoria sp. PMC 1068.18]|nr:hypothetical protein [Oscillatoria sp. PMC 1076.18]MEC4989596.1 hypothetical protein [Oscillatoria sp. PMC 1068.18]